MATFITTIKFTQQGVKDVDHSTKRAVTFKAEAKKLGAKVKEIYWTLGDHDGFHPLKPTTCSVKPHVRRVLCRVTIQPRFVRFPQASQFS